MAENTPKQVEDFIIEYAVNAALEGSDCEVKHGRTAKDFVEYAKWVPFTFSSCGIKPGEVVYFRRDKRKSAVVVDDRHVRVGDEVTSLSAIAKEWLGRNSDVQGPLHFTYKGEVLVKLRDRLAWNKEK